MPATAVLLTPVLWTVCTELIQGEPFSEPADWLGIIIPVVFATFVLPVVWVLTGRAHYAWQFRDAPHVTASLIAATATGTSGSGTEQFKLRAEVCPEGMPPFQATMVEFINLGELPLLVPGAELEVAYLPDERIKLRRIVARPVARDQGGAMQDDPSQTETGRA